MISLDIVGTAFALIAPVYALLFRIQARIGSFGSTIETNAERIAENENEIEELKT